MSGKTKTILVTMGIVAVLAASAPAAGAEQFHAESAPVTLAGSQVISQVFKFETGTVTCKTASLAGEVAVTTAESVTLAPKYEGCTSSTLGPITVDVNGCDFTVSVFFGTTQIACAGTNVIQLTSGLCTVDLEPQNLLGVSFSNWGTGSGRRIDMEMVLPGMRYTQTGKFCLGNGGAKEKLFVNGKYEGTISLRGLSSLGAPVGIWVE